MDRNATALWEGRLIKALLEYLNGQWIRVLLPTLEDLSRKGFNPVTARDEYSTEWNQANISRDMLFAAGLTVTEKLAHQRSWPETYDAWRRYYALVPDNYIQEMRAYWSTGPKPGKAGAATPGNALIGTGDEEWFVTDLSANAVQTTVVIGWSWFSGNITFKSDRGAEVVRKIAMGGPAAGVSWNGADKLGDVQFVRQYLPSLSAFLRTSNEELGKSLNRLTRFGPSFTNWFTRSPKAAKAIEWLAGMPGSTSVGERDWWSDTEGYVMPPSGGKITKDKLRGGALAVTGGGGVSLGKSVSQTYYVMAMGPNIINPLSKWNGVALLSSKSVAAAFPGLGFGFSMLMGEIT